ncbi:hypothetical protein L228DRAFT_62354 [Xylona heveae TC161]|uniref:Uncharacterized protein n=1 Tax=Xylona heveae (strain CBS 132557 / TC161) TaxID=1328760 RepID=A0A165IMP7_XYLHT|nr:hypothetical protein L228DRAFT_62354 [Xylona heveae TC161]KZF25116.1 hypothetical protein L228DRAFT_62354 [Xylona heveae TC161]
MIIYKVYEDCVCLSVGSMYTGYVFCVMCYMAMRNAMPCNAMQCSVVRFQLRLPSRWPCDFLFRLVDPFSPRDFDVYVIFTCSGVLSCRLYRLGFFVFLLVLSGLSFLSFYQVYRLFYFLLLFLFFSLFVFFSFCLILYFLFHFILYFLFHLITIVKLKDMISETFLLLHYLLLCCLSCDSCDSCLVGRLNVQVVETRCHWYCSVWSSNCSYVVVVVWP